MPSAKGWGKRRGTRSEDPVPIGDIVDSLMSEELFARGRPIAELVREWPRIVGERVAAETAPASLEGGVLTVAATDGPWGAQARFLVDEIARRANETLGAATVRSVRVVVRNRR
jgi:hypothetical protein